jgi:anion-transporting  ArsA/GET3 family ATPase
MKSRNQVLGIKEVCKLAANWTEQKIIFVTGKGGVGKSLVAAAIAQEQSKAGRRVLLVEIGETSYYKDFWEMPAIGQTPIAHKGGFDVALWSGESCLREYVLYYLRMKSLYKLFFENRVMRSLVNVAPGLNEIAILGKITSGIRHVGPDIKYDLIVVDGYATGHALALLEAPKGMLEAIRFGPMGHHCREIIGIMSDPKQCGYVVVTLPEELPVVETLECVRTLRSEFSVEAVVIANKVLKLPLDKSALIEFDQSVAEQLRQAKSAQAGEPGAIGMNKVYEFTSHLLSIVSRQSEFLEFLRAEAKCQAAIPEVPIIFSTEPDELLRCVGEAL